MLIYNIIGNEAQVVGFDEPEKNVVIPSHYQGYPVTSIGMRAFAGTAIETAILPDTATEINDYAFFRSRLRWIGCSSCLEERENGISVISANKIGKSAFLGTGLQDIVFLPANGKTTVREFAFAETRKLRNILFSENASEVTLGEGCFYRSHIETCRLPTSWNVLDAIPEQCFMESPYLRSVRFWAKRIEKEAFSGCQNLRNIALLEGLDCIGEGAFEGCQSITEISVPESCRYISPSSFRKTGTKNFSVDADNPHYFSENGVVYSKDRKDRKVLTLFPPARGDAFMIPEGVSAVGTGAFRECYLFDIGFPSTLEEIQDDAFAGAEKLIDITLPDSLERLGEDVFSHCHLCTISIPATLELDWEDTFGCLSVKEVHYRGEKSQFEKMVTGLVNNNSAFFFLDENGEEYQEALAKKRTLQFEYTVYQDGITIDKVLPLFSEAIIPEMIDGIFVRAIGTAAFPSTVQEVYIPDSVQKAPDSLANCIFLRKLSIPGDLWVEPLCIPNGCIVERRGASCREAPFSFQRSNAAN